MLTNEVQHADREAIHADREERDMAKWREKLDHLLDLLHFEGPACGEKYTQSLESASSKSGTWLLKAPLYKSWRDSWDVDSRSLFWLNGKRK